MESKIEMVRGLGKFGRRKLEKIGGRIGNWSNFYRESEIRS